MSNMEQVIQSSLKTGAQKQLAKMISPRDKTLFPADSSFSSPTRAAGEAFSYWVLKNDLSRASGVCQLDARHANTP